jgi:hypothetical protein
MQQLLLCILLFGQRNEEAVTHDHHCGGNVEHKCALRKRTHEQIWVRLTTTLLVPAVQGYLPVLFTRQCPYAHRILDAHVAQLECGEC